MSKSEFLAVVSDVHRKSCAEHETETSSSNDGTGNAPASASSPASTRLQPPPHQPQQQQMCALHAVRSIIRALSPNLKVSLPKPADIHEAQRKYNEREAEFTNVEPAEYFPDPSGNWSETAIRQILLDNELTMDRLVPGDLQVVYYTSWFLESLVPDDTDAWIINNGQAHWYAYVKTTHQGQPVWWNVDSQAKERKLIGTTGEMQAEVIRVLKEGYNPNVETCGQGKAGSKRARYRNTIFAVRRSKSGTPGSMG